VRPIDLNGDFIGDSLIALDSSQAGVGDCVLLIQEGNSIRSIMNDENGAVDTLIVGIVDFIETRGKQRDLTVSYRSG
jgi:ethanolamine utilization protein EutN